MPKSITISTKSKTNIKIAALLATVVGAGLVGYFFVFIPSMSLSGDNVGKLEPTEPPGNLSYSLEDVYNRLINGNVVDLSKKKITPSQAPADTLVTIDNIYQNVPPPDKICQGTNGGTAKCGEIVSVPVPVSNTETPTPTPTETATPTPSPSPVAQENLVLWLKLDEPTGTTHFGDSSGKNNMGTCPFENCPTVGENGKIGGAAKFDYVYPNDENYKNGSKTGSEIVKYIEVKDAENLNPQNITVSTWVNMSTNHTVYSTVLSKFSGDWTKGGWSLGNFYGDDMNFWINTYKKPAKTTIHPDTWLYITGVFDGENMKIYVNGLLMDTVKPDNSQIWTPPSLANLRIGDAGGGFGWNGLIDDVRIFNKALSESEIMEIYNQTKGS